MAKIKPKPILGKPGFRVVFRHPADRSRIVSKSLGTRDEGLALAICQDLDRIVDDGPEVWADPQAAPHVLKYHPRAIAIFFGSSHPAALESAANPGPMAPDEVGNVLGLLAASGALRGGSPEASGEAMDQAAAVLRKYRSAEIRRLQRKNAALQTKLDAYENELREVRAEVDLLRKKQNLHVKVTAGEALSAWMEDYRRGVARRTWIEATRAAAAFVGSLPAAGRCKLGDADVVRLRAWLRGLRRQDGEEISPITRRKMRAYVSTWLSWCQQEYQLAVNPAAQLGRLPGVARHPERIVAIRRQEDLMDLIESLERWPYWQAWVATACLAGPRWSEQARMQIEDVFLEDGYLRISTLAPGPHGPRGEDSGREASSVGSAGALGGRGGRGRGAAMRTGMVGTKTGRERRVPLERTILLSILRRHIANRAAERLAGSDDQPGISTAFVWPSLLGPHQMIARRYSAEGAWSSGSNWHGEWGPVAQAASGGRREGVWAYGPAEWRHTFGTVLGMCGWTSLEIARVMGNSPGIAERHYVALAGSGKRWGFKF